MVITVAEAKVWLNINSSDTSKDTLLTTLIGSVQKEIDGVLGYTVEQAEKIIYKDHDLCLSYNANLPITLTSISGRYLPTDSWTTISGAVLNIGNTVEVYLPNGVVYGYHKLVFNFGWLAASIPNDIKKVACELVKEDFLNSVDDERFNLKSQGTSINGLATSKSFGSMRETLREKLAPYIQYA